MEWSYFGVREGQTGNKNWIYARKENHVSDVTFIYSFDTCKITWDGTISSPFLIQLDRYLIYPKQDEISTYSENKLKEKSTADKEQNLKANQNYYVYHVHHPSVPLYTLKVEKKIQLVIATALFTPCLSKHLI